MENEEIPIIGGGNLIINLGASPETKAGLEKVCAVALAQLGHMYEELPEHSVDRTLVSVAARTLKKTLSPRMLDKMEARIQAQFKSDIQA